jgi:hypothetical protein
VVPQAAVPREEGTSPEAESALADESFESATPVDIASVRLPGPEDGRAAAPEPVNPPPTLDEAVQRIPAETRRTLEELLRARFTAVRRIRPEQLR